jgi:CelD/BcsL family acetyltransferase involved in cellulose biosynthesis
MSLVDSGSDRIRGLVHHFGEAAGPAALDAIGPELDALFAATAPPTTARRPWLDAWVGAFTEFEPWVVVARNESGALTGAALLARRRRAGHLEIVPMGYGPSDYVRLLAVDDAGAEALSIAVARALDSIRRPWRLVVPQLPVDDPVARRLEQALPAAEVVAGDPSPVLHFSQGPELGAYVARKVVREIERARERLEATGADITFDWVRDPDSIVTLLPELEAVRTRRDRELGRGQEMERPAWHEFTETMLTGLGDRGEVEVAVMRVDGTCAAYEIGLLDGAVYRNWERRFDPAWATSSPGKILGVALITRLLTDGEFDEYDYMRGDEPYKIRLSNDLVPATKLLAWSSPRLRRWEQRARRLRSAVRRSR